LGLLGVSVVFVSGLIGFMANIFPLLSLPATILAWLGVAMLVVGDLLLVGAFGRTVLTRLRTSV
jgi:hypothetical protein